MKRNAKLITMIVSFVMVLCVSLGACANGSGGTTSAGTSVSTGTGGGSTGSAGDSTGGTSGSGTTVDLLPFAQGTTLRMATGYNSARTGITFDATTAGAGVTLANGKTYNTGDLKPTWIEVQHRLGMSFNSVYTGKSASAEFAEWQTKLDQVDMVSGTATQLQEAGSNNLVVDIAKYLDNMPNFKAYLDANPIVRLSITGNTATGAIYFSPYFDGADDIERMPLMRADFVTKLLDGEAAFTATSSKNLAAAVYEPYMPTSGTVEVDVVKADGSGTEKLVKNYDATNGGNIVELMNNALATGTVSGVQAVNMLRHYIDVTYNNYYGTTRSNLFIGQNAAWDADELVALLRCVVANSHTLNGTDIMAGLFSRQDHNNQRQVDLFRFAGSLFGVRGLESRNDYLYFDSDGNLVDARQEEETYEALERMNDLKREGLISVDYNNSSASTATSDNYLANDNGFMSYDYNQTQTALGETKLNGKGTIDTHTGEKYMAAMVPVARWFDGTNTDGVYMRFTESWRSVKTDGWGISAAGIGNDTNKLNACLKLIDYAYSKEGQILMSYGPDEFIKVKDAAATNIEDKYECFDFNGEKWPVIADATREELWDTTKGNGSYTNYARYYLGSTLSFLKSQSFEYQCTSDIGREGAGYISTAIALGTIKHPELALTTNRWYASIPTVFPQTAVENTTISGLSYLNAGSGVFSQSSSTGSTARENLFVDIISSGYGHCTGAPECTDRAATLTAVANTYGVNTYLTLRQRAWQRLQNYYMTTVIA